MGCVNIGEHMVWYGMVWYGMLWYGMAPAILGYRIGRCTSISHTLGRFSKIDCSPSKRMPRPNATSSESSRRHVSNADLIGTDIFQLLIPTMEISTMENRPRGM